MKKTLIIIALLFTATISAQDEPRNVMFTVGIDARNATKGSAPTNYEPAADITAGVAFKTGNGGLQIGINYQAFPKIKYYDLELEVGYILEYRKRLLITPQLSTKLIMRGGGDLEYEIRNNEFIGAKISLNIKFEILPETLPGVYFGLDGGGTFRGDKYALIPEVVKSLTFDGTVELTYKININ